MKNCSPRRPKLGLMPLVVLAIVASACTEKDFGDGDIGGDGDSDADVGGDGDGDGDIDGDIGVDGDTGGDTDTGPADTGNDTGNDEGDSGAADISGTHLLVVDTTLVPGLPFQFIAEIDVDLDAGTLDAVLTPLSLGLGQTDAPREELPENVLEVQGIAYGSDGSAVIDLGQVMIEAAANPIVGSDITTTIVLGIQALDADTVCGRANGMVTSPIQQDLTGSTMTAIRLSSRDERPSNFPCEGEGGDKRCFTSCETIFGYLP